MNVIMYDSLEIIKLLYINCSLIFTHLNGLESEDRGGEGARHPGRYRRSSRLEQLKPLIARTFNYGVDATLWFWYVA